MTSTRSFAAQIKPREVSVEVVGATKTQEPDAKPAKKATVVKTKTAAAKPKPKPKAAEVSQAKAATQPPAKAKVGSKGTQVAVKKAPKKANKKAAAKTAKKKAVKKVAKKAVKKVTEKRSSGYQIFIKDNYATVQGAAAGDKLKALAAKWKAWPDSEKAKYNARSQSDEGLKKRLMSPMSLYVKENYPRVQQLPFNERLKALVTEWKALPPNQKQAYVDRTRNGEGAKPLKDRPAVRKYSGYNIFCKENYAAVQGASMGEKAKELAAKWKSMPEPEKAKYNTRSQSAECIKKKRAIPAYAAFLGEKLKGVKGLAPEAIKKVAAEWKALSEAEKNAYKAKAKTL